jgi:hypothetical protein
MFREEDKTLKIRAVKEMIHQMIFVSAFSLMHILSNPKIFVFN